MINLRDDVLSWLAEMVPQMMKRQFSTSFMDLTGQNDNSDTTPTGKIGEYISSNIASGSAIALSNGTPANVTSIALTPGDWDVWGNVLFTGNAATTISNLLGSISNTSATLDTSNGRFGNVVPPNGTTIFAASAQVVVPLTGTRISLAAATTIYLVAQSGFGVNTCAAYGLIQARRRRHFPG